MFKKFTGVIAVAGGLLAVWLLWTPGKPPNELPPPPVPAAPSLAEAPRPNYRYSVIPRGAQTKEELAAKLADDPVAADHYREVEVSRLKPVRLERPVTAYVSYRQNDKVYWTSKPVTLAEGELVLEGGGETVRARCGNRVSAEFRLPVADQEPPLAELDVAELPPGKLNLSDISWQELAFPNSAPAELAKMPMVSSLSTPESFDTQDPADDPDAQAGFRRGGFAGFGLASGPIFSPIPGAGSGAISAPVIGPGDGGGSGGSGGSGGGGNGSGGSGGSGGGGNGSGGSGGSGGGGNGSGGSGGSGGGGPITSGPGGGEPGGGGPGGGGPGNGGPGGGGPGNGGPGDGGPGGGGPGGGDPGGGPGNGGPGGGGPGNGGPGGGGPGGGGPGGGGPGGGGPGGWFPDDPSDPGPEVPEPATLGVIAATLVLMVFLARRARRS